MDKTILRNRPLRVRPVGRLVVLSLLLFFPAIASSQNHTISGTVTDAASGETLIGATVLDTRSGKGAVTNAYGHYSLTLKDDSVVLKVSYVGYEPQQFPMRLTQNRNISVRLKPSVQLDEVVITAERPGDTRSSQMSATQMTMEKIKSVPVMFGEADIIKALQLMPGVQSGSEGNSGMYVRGGGPDENLFLLDGVPLYNVSHLGGFFSAFNTDAVKNVTLYKGSFPARFGGRLSSVLDVTQNNGNDQEVHGNASIGLISAKFTLEGPIVKERTTFSLSARRTYAELFLIPTIMWINELTSETDEPAPDVAQNAKFDAGYYFYDLNAKVTHKFSDKSRLYGSFYLGEDFVHGKVRTVTSLGEDMYMGFKNGWGNMIGSLRWNYQLSPKLFMNASLAYTQYRNNIVGSIEKTSGTDDPAPSTMQGDYSSGIKEATARVDFDYSPLPEHSVKFGTYFTRHWFTPEVATGSVDYYDSVQMNGAFRLDSTIFNGIVPANEMVAFIEDDWSITEALKVNYGLHLSGFRVQDTFYWSPQPRVSGRLMLTDDLSLKLGYAYMTQYVHLLSTTSVSLPTDLWVPVTKDIPPMRSMQVAAGLSYDICQQVELSVEGYYKRSLNLLEYKEGATFMGYTDDWQKQVEVGNGWSYGVEVLLQRTVGPVTGWIGYTWSRSMRQFEHINNGKPFHAKYDREHDLSITLQYQITPRIDIAGTWVYGTGTRGTLTTQVYYVGNSAIEYFKERNGYMMPDYHRLDLAANFHFPHKQFDHILNISCYNVYCRMNPMFVEPDIYSGKLYQVSIFPILPSISYHFKF